MQRIQIGYSQTPRRLSRLTLNQAVMNIHYQIYSHLGRPRLTEIRVLKHQHQPRNLMCTGNQTQRKLIRLWYAEHGLEELTMRVHLSCVQF